MASLGDALPPEMVIEIFDRLHPTRSIKDILISSPTDEDLAAFLRRTWRDRLSLALVNKKHLRTLRPYLYRSISIHGRSSLKRYISLLRFLRANPDVASSVQQVYLDLRPTSAAFSPLCPNYAGYVLKNSKDSTNAGISRFWEYELRLGLSVADVEGPILDYEHECARYTSVFALLLLNMRNVKDLGVSLVQSSFGFLMDRFEICPDPLGNAPRNEKGYASSDELTDAESAPIFESIQAISLRAAGSMHNTVYGFHVGALLWMFPKATSLYVEGQEFSDHRTVQPGLRNITDLTVNGLGLSKDELSRVIHSCASLSSFGYLAKKKMKRSIWSGPIHAPSATDIVCILRGTRHNSTLRAIYLDFCQESTAWPARPPVSLDGFSSLECVRLYFDAKRMTDDVSFEQDKKTLRSLPSTVRWLQLGGSLWTREVLKELDVRASSKAETAQRLSVDIDTKDGGVGPLQLLVRRLSI